MGNRKPLKIAAGVIAVLLIGGILFIVNSFVGNPLSAMSADKAIKNYVNKNYSFLNLEVGKAKYNFKVASYVAMARSRTNVDIHFAVYYRDGKVKRDDYDTYVQGMFNTLQRLSEEYSEIAKALVASELGFKDNTTMVMYDKSEYGKDDGLLKLGMKFDKSLPLNAEVVMRINLTDNSIEKIAKILTDAHEVFKKNGCNFSKYGLYSESEGMLVMVNEVTPEAIESGELVSLLKKAKNNESGKGINVFIKEEKKSK